MRVLDMAGANISAASATVTAGISVHRAVRSVVNKIYSQLNYTGFNERTLNDVLSRNYPKRPTVDVTEDAIKNSRLLGSIEGIWTDAEDHYRLGIIHAHEGKGTEYIAVVLSSRSPLWQPGEIKAEITETAVSGTFSCTYYMQNKKKVGTTLTMESN